NFSNFVTEVAVSPNSDMVYVLGVNADNYRIEALSVGSDGHLTRVNSINLPFGVSGSDISEIRVVRQNVNGYDQIYFSSNFGVGRVDYFKGPNQLNYAGLVGTFNNVEATTSLAISADGQTIYLSSRVGGSIAWFSRDQLGNLTYLGKRSGG